MDYSPILFRSWRWSPGRWSSCCGCWSTRHRGDCAGSASPWATSRRARAASTWTAGADDQAQWKSHNYNHLMEQPTIFYAIAITLALMDFGGGINYWLAWGYVGFRVVHSLVQVHGQRRPIYRLPLFVLASLCLIGADGPRGAADPARLRDALAAEAGRPARHGSTSGTGRPAAPSRACSRRRPASRRRGRRSPGLQLT